MIHRQVAALGASLLLAACGQWSGGNQSERAAGAASFPRADRPVAPIVSTRWSSEEARDRVNEAEDIMDRAGIRPGMTIADIGAGEAIIPCAWPSALAPGGGCWPRIYCPR